ncbi:response regulator [Paenibacillus sp. ACRRY]|nr:response regulator [Paenibacillus sp. ACRRY]
MSQRKKITVIVAEDEPIIKNHIITKIEQAAPDFKVIASSFNGKDALDAILRLNPDVVFTDIRMPVMDGMELITNIRAVMPEIPIVVLSGYNEFEYARQAIRLNVLDYLLKPLDTEMLLSTLNQIRSKVLSANTNQLRQVISSMLHGESDNTLFPNDLGHVVFQMFLINAGNLCDHITSLKHSASFNSLWLRINWQELINRTTTPILDWWLIDEKMLNQKFLIIAYPIGNKEDILATGETLWRILINVLAPYTVSICMHAEMIAKDQLWKASQDLRMLMEQGVCIGQSQFMLFPDDQRQTPSVIPSLSVQQIRSVLDNPRALHNLITEHLVAIQNAAIPQRQAEVMFAETMKMIQRNQVVMSATNFSNIEYEIAEMVCTSLTFEEVCERLWKVIERNCYKESGVGKTSQLVESIKNYFKNHYSEDISLEEIAQQMNFSSAYLTKIFKKYTSESPVKYLTNYRMSEAKRLLIEHPDLDIRIVAEMTGYFDQHYFSKVFKGVVGQTPSEFRFSKTD